MIDIKKRCYIYARVSTKAQADEGYSIPEQLDRLNKYADAMGWLVAQVFVDPGHSGATLERPALQEMLSVISDTDIVLVDKLDRLSRSLVDTLYVVKRIFEPHNVSLVSRVESFDTGSSFGRAALGIMGVFAELERERIKERTHDGMVGRTKAGYWHGNAPQGYRKESGTLVADGIEAIRMCEAFEMAAQGRPLLEVYAHVYDKKPDGAAITTLRRQLGNRAYIGEVKFGGEWYQGLHEPLVDTDTFNAVQQMLYERSRANERYKPGVKYTSPLGGLLWCGRCGAKYHYRLACLTRKTADGSKNHYRYSYYGCYSRTKADKKLIRDPSCKNDHYQAAELEAAVYSEIRALRNDPTYIERLRKSADPTDKRRAIQQRIDTLTGQINKLMDLYTIGSIPHDLIAGRLEPLTAEKRGLERELAELQNAAQIIPTDKIIQLAETFERTVESGDPAAIHTAITSLIDYITIDGDQITINWRF